MGGGKDKWLWKEKRVGDMGGEREEDIEAEAKGDMG